MTLTPVREATTTLCLYGNRAVGRRDRWLHRNFFMEGVIRYCKGLPREESLSLEVSREGLDMSLSALGWFTRWRSAIGWTQWSWKALPALTIL